MRQKNDGVKKSKFYEFQELTNQIQDILKKRRSGVTIKQISRKDLQAVAWYQHEDWGW